MILTAQGDGIKAKRIACVLRKIRSRRVTAGSASHGQMELVIEGTPARCFVLKPIRAL